MPIHNRHFTPSRHTYEDGTVISHLSEDSWQILHSGETLLCEQKGKPVFANDETGERVIEFTGMATDQRTDRSWARAVFKKRGFSPRHYHNEREEYYYVTAGVAKVLINNQHHTLMPGEFIKILPKQQHQVFGVGEHSLEIMVKCAPAWIFEDQHACID